MHDGCAAVMRDAVVAHGVKHGLRIDLAQTHVHARTRRHRPRKAPAVAMEHGQRPQIGRVLGHVPLQNVRDRVGGRAPVVVDHALGVARGATGVVQRNRVPFIAGQAPRKVGITTGHKSLVRERAQRLGGPSEQRILHVNHQQRPCGLAQRQRFFHDARKFRVDDHGLGLAVVQHEGHGFRIESGVERVEHGTRHRDAKVRLDHGRRVGQHHSHRVVLANARLREGAGQLATAAVGAGPILTQIAVQDGQTGRVDLGRALDEAERRHRGMVGGGLGQILVEYADFGIGHGLLSVSLGLQSSRVCLSPVKKPCWFAPKQVLPAARIDLPNQRK